MISRKFSLEWYIKYCISKIFDFCDITTGGHCGFFRNGGVAKDLGVRIFFLLYLILSPTSVQIFSFISIFSWIFYNSPLLIFMLQLRLEKYRLFDLTKFVSGLPMFWLIQQTSSRNSCWMTWLLSGLYKSK